MAHRTPIAFAFMFAALGGCSRAPAEPAGPISSTRAKTRRAPSVTEAIPDEGTLLAYVDIKALRATPTYQVLLDLLKANAPQLNLGSSAACGASLFESMGELANASGESGTNVTVAHLSMSGDATFACLRELFPVESAVDAGPGRLRLSDAYGVAAWVDGLLVTAPRDQLDKIVARIEADEPHSAPPWLRLDPGETVVVRILPRDIPTLSLIQGRVKTTPDGFALQMRSEMDSAETAQHTVETFHAAQGLLKKQRSAISREMLEMLQGAELSAEGKVFNYRVSVQGDAIVQRRALEQMIGLARSQANVQRNGASPPSASPLN